MVTEGAHSEARLAFTAITQRSVKMKFTICGLITLNLSLGVAACSGTYEHCQPPRDDRYNVVEFYTWWTKQAEARAAQTLTGDHEASYTDTEVRITSMGTSDLARWHLKRRVVGNAYADVFQTNIGKDFSYWLGTDLVNLNGKIPGLQLHDVFDEKIRKYTGGADQQDPVRCIPLDIHRVNTLYYNQGLIDPNTLKTLEDFESACRDLHDNHNVVPIALGTRSSAWHLALFLHEALLPALAGGQRYEAFWSGVQSDVLENELKAAYSKVIDWWRWGWINNDHATLEWSEAAGRILESGANQAAFVIMGDWLTPILQSKQAQGASGTFGRMAFPSQAGRSAQFVYTADCFPTPSAAPHSQQAIELLTTFASQTAQIDFSNQKGSIPARSDISDEMMKKLTDDAARATASEYKNSQTEKALAGSGLISPTALPQLTPNTLQLLPDPSNISDQQRDEIAANLVKYIRANYWQLAD